MPQLPHQTVWGAAWSWRTWERDPLWPLPPPPVLAGLWHCLIFLFENKTLTTVFLVRACLRTLRGHWVGWGNYHYSSRPLIDWGVVVMLAFDKLHLVSSTLELEFLSWSKHTYYIYTYPCVVIYISITYNIQVVYYMYHSALYVKMYIFIYKCAAAL